MTTYPKILKLDVGGVKYKTSLKTLQKFPESYLSQLFSGDIESPHFEDGEYFLDADGEIFKYILNFLRRGELMLPDGFKEYNLLAAEARFFQIQPLIQQLDETKCNSMSSDQCNVTSSGKLKHKRMLMVWGGDKWPVDEDAYNLNTSYLESSARLFEKADNLTTNLTTKRYSDANRIFLDEGYTCAKKYSRLDDANLWFTLQAYGVTSVPVLKCGHYMLEVWERV